MMAKDYRIKSWRQATIVEQTSPVTYDVKTDDGCIWRRHIDQLRICNLRSSVSSTIKSSELLKDSVIPDISLTSNIRDNIDKGGGAFLTNYNVSDCQVTANGDISARRQGEITAAKPRQTVSTRTEVGRRSSRISKPRQILDL